MQKILILCVVMAFGLTACQTTGQKQTIGTLGGAVLGSVAGAQFGKGKGQYVTIGIGALLGGLAGSKIGAALDERDRVHAEKAMEKAYVAPMNEVVTWNNPENDHRGSYTPVREGYTQTGDYCREYKQTVTIDGQTEMAHGTACQEKDGSWRIVP